MRRLAGITFNTNNYTEEVGFMEYITGETGNIMYPVIRKLNRELYQRYFVVIDNELIDISNYLESTDIMKIEACYKKKIKINAPKFFIVQLINWSFDKSLS